MVERTTCPTCGSADPKRDPVGGACGDEFHAVAAIAERIWALPAVERPARPIDDIQIEPVRRGHRPRIRPHDQVAIGTALLAGAAVVLAIPGPRPAPASIVLLVAAAVLVVVGAVRTIRGCGR